MTQAATAPVRALVPMIHVADVETSVLFYRKLGFEVGNSVPPGSGPKEWAWLYSPKVDDWKRGPNLMVTRRSGAAGTNPEGFLLYLYAADLERLRSQMIADGLQPTEISYPDYLPDGEVQITDPDGYILMIAQSASDTP